MDLLLISDKNKLHYVYIKDFNRFMCNKTINKNIKTFLELPLTMFSYRKSFNKTQRKCLIISCKESVKLKSGSIEFKCHFKQLAV